MGPGSGNGFIPEDEENKPSCRGALEKHPKYRGISCGVYGSMAHTVFCIDSNCRGKNEAAGKVNKVLSDAAIYGVPLFTACYDGFFVLKLYFSLQQMLRRMETVMLG